MEKKVVSLILVVLLLSIAAAGCLGGDNILDEKRELEEDDAMEPETSGGVVDEPSNGGGVVDDPSNGGGVVDEPDDNSSEDDVTDTGGEESVEGAYGYGSINEISGWAQRESGDTAQANEPVTIKKDKLIKIVFNIVVEDSDVEHSETDEGSDPDEISVVVKWGDIIEKGGPKWTPAVFNITIFPEEGEYLSTSGNVEINGKLNGGKGAYTRLGFVVYVDQGFAYTINADYVFEK